MLKSFAARNCSRIALSVSVPLEAIERIAGPFTLRQRARTFSIPGKPHLEELP